MDAGVSSPAARTPAGAEPWAVRVGPGPYPFRWKEAAGHDAAWIAAHSAFDADGAAGSLASRARRRFIGADRDRPGGGSSASANGSFLINAGTFTGGNGRHSGAGAAVRALGQISGGTFAGGNSTT